MNITKKTRKMCLRSLVLALCMLVTLLASMPMAAQASSKVDSKYWIEAAKLGTFGMSGSKTIGKVKFGLNGSEGRTWAICGKDGNDLVLLSTTGFATGKYGLTSEYSKGYFVEDLKKPNSSYLGTDYFSSGELGKMQPVTVKTEEPDISNGGNHTVSVENLKLYLPNSKNQWSWDETTIYVGKDNNIPVDLKTHMIPTQGFQAILFWLRSPEKNRTDFAHVSYPGIDVNSRYVQIKNAHFVTVMPALNLDMSSVLFASTADAAAINGFTASSAMKENTYTLRYESNGAEAAEISADGSQVSVKDAKDKYLVAQGNGGAYVKKIEKESEIIAAADMSATSGGVLADFKNCEVWIESTTDRITTAKAATFDHDYNADWSSDATKHWHECKICGNKKDIGAHTGGTATCTKKAKCEVCGTEYGKLAAHDFKWVVDKKATVTAAGSKHKECKICGYKKAAVAIPKTGTDDSKTLLTGDSNNLILWIALLFVSCGGVIGTTVYIKKRKSIR